jgi:PilZ domain
MMSQTNPISEARSAWLTERPDPEQTPPFDGRVWPRFDAPPGTSCRLTTITGGETLSAAVANVSCGGLRLLTDMPLARGTCLLVELRSRSGFFVRVLLTHIIHVSQENDGRFALGGEFLDPLTGEELQLFLA